MSCYEIEGGRPLTGRLTVQGAKNSALPILAACLLAPEPCEICNCPRLSDVSATLKILSQLGCRVKREGDRVTVDPTNLSSCRIPEQLMGEMRSSVIFMGALLARLGRAELSFPGGCELGPRPIDLHLRGLRAMGAEILEEGGSLRCRWADQREGRELYLTIPSVGATENLMLAACGVPGETTILGAAREPEIVDLQNFLLTLGAEVTGAGTDRITVRGGTGKMHGCTYTVMGDRIAAATYLCAAGAAGGEVELTGVEPEHLAAVLGCLEEAGCRIRTGRGLISLKSGGELQGIGLVRTAPYPGFPTDAQAILMAALAGGRGTTLFEENMFSSRFRHVDELRRMGAQIETAGRAALVMGTGGLHGAAVTSTDLRGGAALVVAGLAAQGTTQVRNLRHIRRGYEKFEETLTALGGKIREVSEP